MKAEMVNMKTEFKYDIEVKKRDVNKQILELKAEMKNELEKKCCETPEKVFATLFGKLRGLEAGMKEKLREMSEAQHLKMMEVDGRVGQVVLRTILEQLKAKEEKSSADQLALMETLSERVRSNDGDLRVLKSQMKDEREKKQATKKKKKQNGIKGWKNRELKTSNVQFKL